MKVLSVLMSLIIVLSGCKKSEETKPDISIDFENATKIELSDNIIKVNGEKISTNSSDDIYSANDIVYYPEGKDFTFGEGEKEDEHSKEEADAHTVVHITKPGTYSVSGKLSKGQLAIDLGDDAKDDPDAVVNILLNNADISCSVAPAVIFYNVYECGKKDAETAKMDVDTKTAGANVYIADGSVNNISGSYVARIYKSVELSDDGTEVIDSKKLHKYDAAFYSKMSMNIYDENKGDGILNITAENEGLDSELHLTVNGGIINIKSGNDGINTNEDNVSVTTINGGELNITVTGETGEGDGIDSNGWLVINGGTVTASACGISGDSGIDADMGVYINGGTVMASGNMLDRMLGDQGHNVFNFGNGFDISMKGGNTYTIKNKDGDKVISYTPENNFTNLVFSSPKLTEGEYSLWVGENRLGVAKAEGNFGMHGGTPPGGEKPDGDFKPPEGMPEPPEGMPPRGEMPDGEFPKGERPNGKGGPGGRMNQQAERLDIEYSDTFKIEKGTNYFIVSAQ